MFDTDCVNGMRAQINFQSCWDGQNLYLPNSEHVAYLSGIDYGSCPPTHPIPIPGLFYEVLYWTNRVDQSAGGQFVFSNGDATGYGFHGDFLNGWNQDVQTAAVQQCLYTDNGGVVSACPALAASDDINVARSCPESPSVWDEPVHGSLSSLPGCNPITSGPGIAPQVICPLNSNTPTQSEAASLAVSTSTSSSTTFLPNGLLTSTASTSTAAPFPTDGFNSVTTTGPFSQSTPGIFATDSANSTGFPSVTNAISQTPLLSFTTIVVTATATDSTSTSTVDLGADTTTFVTATQVFTAELTSTFTTSISTPTSTTAFRRRNKSRRNVEDDLARMIEEVADTKGDEEAKHGKDTSTDQPDDTPTEEQDEDQGHPTYHGSGMGCMLWGSCA